MARKMTQREVDYFRVRHTPDGILFKGYYLQVRIGRKTTWFFVRKLQKNDPPGTLGYVPMIFIKSKQGTIYETGFGSMKSLRRAIRAA